ncbi:MAG TPA: response regulator, partial [Gammaproteobacteria bacterium]|nr:response regulator [Gammaproteobacteria bacterium]
IRNRLAAVLGERGLKVRAFASARECLAALEDLANAPTEPVLLIDLIMPRMDGGGMLGGLELADRVRKRFPGLALFMISDHANPEAERQARGLGVREVFGKPRHEQLARPDGAQALADLADRLLAHCRSGDGPAEDSADGHYNLGAELFRELGVAEAPGARVNATPGLHLLRGMLQELNAPGLGAGTILLVLRFASELMNRAVVFFVKDREIVGLGQFGLEIDGRSADAVVRRIRIPLDQESILRRALEARTPLRADPGDSELDDYLFRELGGRRPKEIFLGPILSEGKVVAILYGDNLPEEKAIGDTETLEIFLSQAGLAMEKALLERRLRGRSGD